MSQKASASFIIPSNTTTTGRPRNEEDKNSEHVLQSYYKPLKNRASRSVPSRRIQSPYLDSNLDETIFAEDDSGSRNNNSLSNAKRMQKQKPLPAIPPKSSSFAVIETHKNNSFLQGQTP